MRGKFICLDGTEGSGKSSQIQAICSFLQQHGKTVITTREPGGTQIGEAIRELVLSPHYQPQALTELLLILAARHEHLQTVILPHLAAGTWVISDRFNDATYAYQGYGRGIDLKIIKTLEQIIQASFQPDLACILCLPEHIAAERVHNRAHDHDRIELENRAFFARVAQGYHARAQLPHACFIDASGDQNSVFQQIRHHLELLL